ncbi:MAG: hypothetical protein QOE70_5155 [Chthoniobacter sp.]|jgi:hypothetical protein|nr:hypothetical protein [Chthoniobacter sp.]
MRSSRSLHIHIPLQGTVDFDNDIIRNVAVTTGDVEAEGHDTVGDTIISMKCPASEKLLDSRKELGVVSWIVIAATARDSSSLVLDAY